MTTEHGAPVEVDPEDFDDPEILHAKLMRRYLETDDPIIWRILAD